MFAQEATKAIGVSTSSSRRRRSSGDGGSSSGSVNGVRVRGTGQDAVWTAESILEKEHISNRGVEYLVKRRGSEETTREPERTLMQDTPRLVRKSEVDQAQQREEKEDQDQEEAEEEQQQQEEEEEEQEEQ